MKRAVLLLLTTACFSTATLALEQTEIEMTGGKITGVKQVQGQREDAFPDFAQADANGDGCVNRQEALNVGILTGTFNKYVRKGCLIQPAIRPLPKHPVIDPIFVSPSPAGGENARPATWRLYKNTFGK